MASLLHRLRPFLPFVLLFGLALGLRLYRLDAQSLWLDEGGSWAEVTGRTGKGWGVLTGELFSPDAGYPLYHLLLKGWVAVAGDSEWALRFPSAMAGALAVVVLGLLGIRDQGSGIRGQGSGVRDQGSGIRDQETVRPQTADCRHQTADQQTADTRHQTADQQTADTRHQTPDRRHQTADTRHQTPDQQTADTRPQTPDRRHQTADTRPQTSRYQTPDIRQPSPYHSPVPGTQNSKLKTLFTIHYSPFTIYHSPFTIFLGGLLAAVSPFLLWHAQDAKAYSLLLLVVSLLFLATLRALRNGGQAWLWVLLVAIVSVFVHRLALLAVAAAALGALCETRGRGSGRVGEWEAADSRQQPGRVGDQELRRPAQQGAGAGKPGNRGTEETADRRHQTADTRPGDRGAGRSWDVVERAKLPFPGFRMLLMGVVMLGAIGGLWGTLRAAGGERAFITRSAVGPLESLWLTLLRFSVDRWPGDLNSFLGLPLLVWLLPFGLLGLWGLLVLLRDAWDGRFGAAFLLCILWVPLVLVMFLTALSPIYEARYTIVAFPGWLLLLTYPGVRGQGSGVGRWEAGGLTSRIQHLTFNIQHFLLALVLLVSVVTLFQPKKGLFSGDPLKEQWREAVQYLAQHAQPDDLLLIHPSYVALMYDYYAARVTPDPLPQAVTFPIFAEGYVCGLQNPTQRQAYECWVRRYDPFFNEGALGKKRALLLIAPDHARTVDPPKTLEMLTQEAKDAGKPLPTHGDRYGGLGLRFEYPQDTWPCGGTDDALIGVEVMCQSYPDTFNASGPGQVPEPDTRLEANFGNELHLRGFSIRPFGDRLRAGGSLPITLYWSALVKPAQNYRMFLHLCRDCSVPPLANDDGPPLAGLFPAGESSSWIANDPVHDERSLVLPANLAPGRYTVLLGVYAGDGSEASRLAISDTTGQVLDGRRLVLTEVEVGE